MSRHQPLQYLWWLVSDASGIVALGLVSLSVFLDWRWRRRCSGGRASSVRRRAPTSTSGWPALAAIAVHCLALLGDHRLKPGWRGITIPFALNYKPGITGIGIIAGYLAVLLGLGFHLRRRIGARKWRSCTARP